MKAKLILILSLSVFHFACGQQKEKIHKYKYRDKLPEAPQGIWEFYDFNGELDQKYDFTKSALIFRKENPKSDTVKYKVITGTDTIRTTLDRPPLMIGGVSVLLTFLVKNLRYPAEASRNGIQGKAKVAVVVDKDGKPISYKSLNHIGSGIDEEALRVVKLFPYGWIPAILHGENVTAEVIQIVYFKLEDR